MLGPRHLVETESRACIVQSLADEVAAGGRDVRILLPEDLEFFSNPMINFLHLPADYYGRRVLPHRRKHFGGTEKVGARPWRENSP